METLVRSKITTELSLTSNLETEISLLSEPQLLVELNSNFVNTFALSSFVDLEEI